MMPRPRGGDWLEDELRSMCDQGVDVLVSLLTNAEMEELDLLHEAMLAKNLGMDFHSFPILDRTTPDPSASIAEFFDALLPRFLSGDSIVVHCRMGIGRSSLVAATLLSLAGSNPNDAFEKVSLARGMDVPDTNEQRQWVTKFIQLHRPPS